MDEEPANEVQVPLPNAPEPTPTRRPRLPLRPPLWLLAVVLGGVLFTLVPARKVRRDGLLLAASADAQVLTGVFSVAGETFPSYAAGSSRGGAYAAAGRSNAPPPRYAGCGAGFYRNGT